MFHLRSPLIWLACAALSSFVVGGCSSSFGALGTDFTPFNTGDGGASDDATPGPAYDVAADAGTAPSLCGIDPSSACSPDESVGDKLLAKQCAGTSVPDAGNYADASASGPACRLGSNGKEVIAACGLA